MFYKHKNINIYLIWKHTVSHDIRESTWYCVEKAVAPHSSTLAWKIPWMEEPGGLQSMGSRRVGNNWATSFSLFTFMHWRRKWQSTPVFLPGESQGWGSLVGCRLLGRRVGHDWRDLAAAAAHDTMCKWLHKNDLKYSLIILWEKGIYNNGKVCFQFRF